MPNDQLLPLGDAGDAIDFAVGHCGPEEAIAFLDDWRADRAGEWPGYVSWLETQNRCAAISRATPPSVIEHDVDGDGKPMEPVKYLAPSDEQEVERALADPNAVHINMLRGGIAKPSARQIWHIYGKELADEMPEEICATLSAMQDNGAIELREALRPFQTIAKHCAGEPDDTVLYTHQGWMGDYPLTIGDFRRIDALLSIQEGGR